MCTRIVARPPSVDPGPVAEAGSEMITFSLTSALSLISASLDCSLDDVHIRSPDQAVLIEKSLFCMEYRPALVTQRLHSPRRYPLHY